MYAQEDGVSFQGLKKERVFPPVFFFGAVSCVWARTALVLQGLKKKRILIFFPCSKLCMGKDEVLIDEPWPACANKCQAGQVNKHRLLPL
jgi:hypothetical protein